MQFPLSQPWSVWWFFHADGRFDGWYGNLESPKARWELPDGTCGLDTADRELDIEIEIDLTWSWKDEEPFVARAGSPGYWTTHQVDEIRADGYRLIAMVQDRLPPFDGRFTAFRVDPEWPLPDLPCLRQHRPVRDLELRRRCWPEVWLGCRQRRDARSVRARRRFR